MRLGPLPVREAAGAVLAHAIRLPGRVLKKGRVLDGSDLEALLAGGQSEIIAARLDPDDIPEDRAAARAAAGLAGSGLRAAEPFTGRVNLHAESAGLLILDRETIDRLNHIDESLTVATLEPYAFVHPGQMVATIKVIPFAAPESVVAAWERAASPMRVAPFRSHRVGLVQTRLPVVKPSVLDKTAEVTRRRLAALGCTLVAERRCEHREDDVADAVRELLDAGADLVLVAGASAIIDRRDVVPAGIEQAGGEILQFGMPADPGNLLLFCRMGDVPVLGLPGCARSPKMNGFDWVLERIVAGLPVGSREIMAMGVGGLLAETPARGLPRETGAKLAAPHPTRVAAVVLAAGRSTRMGSNKLLKEVEGVSLVERAVDVALASRAAPVIVVLGHDADAVAARLQGRRVTFVSNPDYADGLSTSLKAGMAALPEDADAAVVCLGDMPRVTAELIDRLIAAFNPVEGREIVVPVHEGRRGNPVLWGRRFFPDLAGVTGDTGAKHLIGSNAEFVTEIEAGHGGIFLDIDTPDAFEAFRTGRAAD